MVNQKNMNREFFMLHFRNFDFLIDNSHNFRMIYSKIRRPKLDFEKQIKKFGTQNS